MTEILFLTHNRREYTAASLRALLANTPAALIHRIAFFDDRSEDGTHELVVEEMQSLRVPSELRRGRWDSPVEAMAEFFQSATGELVAKIDSDVMVPPGWLEDCERLLAENPEIDLVGIEARGESSAESGAAGVQRYADRSAWVGGIFVARRAAIVAAMGRRPLFCDRSAGKWFGWQTFQEQAPLRVAWIRPSLQVFLLDRMSVEPWRSLSDEYVRRGWQRPAPYRYGPQWSGLWGWHEER